jgi:hypothetical protein
MPGVRPLMKQYQKRRHPKEKKRALGVGIKMGIPVRGLSSRLKWTGDGRREQPPY